MKQYKITSETFRLEGEDSTLPSCVVDPEELARMKKLAGIDQLGLMERVQAEKKMSSGLESPVSGEIGTSKAEYQRKHNIRPGTDEWFRLWFARPNLTGEKPTGPK